LARGIGQRGALGRAERQQERPRGSAARAALHSRQGNVGSHGGWPALSAGAAICPRGARAGLSGGDRAGARSSILFAWIGDHGARGLRYQQG
jgi:hypothetical protein